MKKISILIIGDEILNGSVVDTNSHYLATKLAANGYELSKIYICSDFDISYTLHQALDCSDVVISVGGMGFTHDDKTLEVLLKLPNVATKSLIPNELGGIQGVVLEYNNKIIIPLPGVPCEMETMVDKYLFKILVKHIGCKPLLYKRINFCHTREEEIVNQLNILVDKYEGINFGIYPKLTNLSVIISGNKDEKKKEIDAAAEDLRSIKQRSIFLSDDGLIEWALHEELLLRKERLVVGESCTGGALSSGLTQFSGASNYFLSGLVVYSDDAKCSLLGVPRSMVQKNGAVSEIVTRESLRGIFKISDATLAVSVSGVAGPSCSENKPVGTVYAAIGRRDGEVFSGLIPMHMNMPRNVNIKHTCEWVFGALWRMIKFGENSFETTNYNR